MRAEIIIAASILTIGLLISPVALAQGGAGDDGGERASAGDDQPVKKVTRRSRRKARKKVKQGTRLVGEQKYGAAIKAFQEAYAFDPQPATLYNLGTVSRLKGDARKAYEYYEQYLSVAPKGPLAASSKRFMTGLEAQIAEEDARLAREKKLQEQAEKTRLEAEKARQEAATAKVNQAEALERAEAELAENREAMSVMKQDRDDMEQLMRSGRGSTKRLIGVSLMAVGGLAFGWAIKSGLDASSANSELDSLGMDDTWGQGYQWVHDHGQSSQSRMILFSISGALLVGGGVTMYLLGNREAKRALDARKPSVSVVPTVSPRAAGVQVTGRF